MDNKKRKKAWLVTSAFFITAMLIFFLNTNLRSISIINRDKKISFYCLNTFRKTYVIKLVNKNIFTARILLCNDIVNISRLISGKNVYILCSSESTLKLYSSEGRLITEFAMNNKRIKSLCTGDINLDGIDEILMVTGTIKNEFGNEIIVLAYKDKFTQLYAKSMEALNPWKIQICDVDGDKKADISIGVYKTTLFHPVMARRPFIYNWENSFISPKWLGSRLSQPFDDYVFCDLDNDGMDEIAAIENTEDNKKVISIYKWKGFGVEQISTGEKYNDMDELSIVNDNLGGKIIVKANKNSKWRWYTISYSNDKVFLNKGNSFININVY